jgi:heme/copper-type cytochrome/quinol oxidase subunit 3
MSVAANKAKDITKALMKMSSSRIIKLVLLLLISAVFMIFTHLVVDHYGKGFVPKYIQYGTFAAYVFIAVPLFPRYKKIVKEKNEKGSPVTFSWHSLINFTIVMIVCAIAVTLAVMLLGHRNNYEKILVAVLTGSFVAILLVRLQKFIKRLTCRANPHPERNGQ